MDADIKIRNEIHKVMHEKRISQAELARRLGVTPQAIGPLLRGTRGKQPQSLLDVLNALDLELTVKPKAGASGEQSGWRALAASFDDPDSPGDVSARHDDYLGEALEQEHQEGLEGRR